MNDQLNTKIAITVILPMLKKIVADDKDDQITTITSMRACFNTTYDESISSSKFQEWIDLLEIKFKRKTVILWPDSERGSSSEDESSESINEVENVEDTMSSTFPGVRPMNVDAFNQC